MYVDIILYASATYVCMYVCGILMYKYIQYMYVYILVCISIVYMYVCVFACMYV